jgi:putative endonuclease
MRKSSRKKGKEAEDIAANYLVSRGFEIVERNFTIRGGEIDIIARDGDTLVFVEVKSSRTPLFDPIEQMTRRKISFLKRAAEIYLFKKGLLDRINCRFDVITVKFRPDGETEIRHFKNAFDY